MSHDSSPSVDSTPRVKTPPMPPADPLIGHLRLILRDPLRFMLRVSRQYGDVVHIRVFNHDSYLINHPDGIKRVLQDNQHNYDKTLSDYDTLRLLLGNGLLTNQGDSWLQQRRLMQPAFHRKRIAAFGTLMTNETVAMVDHWRPFVERGQPLDIAAEMMRLTLNIVGQALFSLDLSGEAATIGRAFPVANKYLSDRLYAPFLPPNLPTPRNRRFQAAKHALESAVDTIIAERRRRNENTSDLLSMLLAARDEDTGAGMNDRQLRDEILTLLLAGHETTANALTWTWYLLSQHPAVERRLRAEVAEVLGGRTPTVEDLPKLRYTRMVIEEAMRLYPPAWGIPRRIIADDTICGYHIPAGVEVSLSLYTMHRHPAFWDNPDAFDPERFTPERTEGCPPFAYFPFGGGPRLCIGAGFAMTEAQLILATVAQRYRLHLVPGHAVTPEPLITLRPKGGMPMTVQAA